MSVLSQKKSWKTWITDPDKLIFILMILMFAERIATMFDMGLDYLSTGDTVTYIESGIHFAKTGIISIRNEYPTALIMPGMPVLIGLLTFVFGTGDFLWHIGLRLVWYVIGVVTVWFVYKAVSRLSSGWIGILAALCWFAPNRAWMNNVLMTETPYSFFYFMAIYFTIAMAQENERKYFIGFCIAFMGAFMFRANAFMLLPPVVLYLLLAAHIRLKVLLKYSGIFCLVLLLFLVPWTIRNYVHFHAFIPITYGTGHPTYLGTYQGEGYPDDSELDYETNVYDVARERFSDYYDEEGNLKDPVCEQYIEQETWGIMASYRLSVWRSANLASLLKSFLIIKPRWMLNWVWYWDQVFGVSYEALHLCSQINLVLSVLSLAACWVLKKHRADSLFFFGTYIFTIYIHAFAFASDRYSACIYPLRYMTIALGIHAVILYCRQRRKAIQQ